MGGTSSERAISLSTGRQILAALDPSNYLPMALDAAALSSGERSIGVLEPGSNEPSTPPLHHSHTPSDLIPLSMAQLERCEPGAPGRGLHRAARQGRRGWDGAGDAGAAGNT